MCVGGVDESDYVSQINATRIILRQIYYNSSFFLDECNDFIPEVAVIVQHWV